MAISPLVGEQIYYKGFAFPFSFGPDGSIVQAKFSETDYSLLRYSLAQIILTGVGEVVANRNYGCSITGLVFDRVTPAIVPLIHQSIISAVSLYEPRVQIVDINVDQVVEDNGDQRILVSLQYQVPSVGALDSVQVTV
jgi:phage baseplate assembly protein W